MEIILMHFVVTIFACVLIYLSNPDLRLPSFSQFFSVFYIFFILLGSYLLVFKNQEEFAKTLLITNLGFFFFSIGCFLSSVLNSLNKQDIYKFINKSLCGNFKDLPFSLSIFFLLVFSSILAALYFRNGIPFWANNVDEARLLASTGSGYYLIGITRIMPLVVLISMAKLYLPTGKIVKAIFFIAFIMCILSNILSGYRAPLAAFIIMILMLHFYIKSNFTWKFLFFSFSLFLVVFFGVTYWKLRDNNAVVYLLWENFQHRVLFDNPRTVYYLERIFPQKFTFFLGKSYIMDLISALPGPGISFGGWLFSQTFSKRLFGIAALTPTLVGEFYANFSLFGACILMLLFGCALNICFIKVIRSKKNPITFAFWIAISFSLANSATLGLGTTILTRIFIYLIVFGMFLFFYTIFDIEKKKI